GAALPWGPPGPAGRLRCRARRAVDACRRSRPPAARRHRLAAAGVTPGRLGARDHGRQPYERAAPRAGIAADPRSDPRPRWRAYADAMTYDLASSSSSIAWMRATGASLS